MSPRRRSPSIRSCSAWPPTPNRRRCLSGFWGYYSNWAKHRIPWLRLVMLKLDLDSLGVGGTTWSSTAWTPRSCMPRSGPSTSGSSPCARTATASHIPPPAQRRDHRRSGIEELDLLLCDVQGAETATLIAALALAVRRIRFRVLSTHHHSISGDPFTHQRCLSFLRDAGPHIVAEHSVTESCSGDGLIAAPCRRPTTTCTRPCRSSALEIRRSGSWSGNWRVPSTPGSPRAGS
jgi:hypothetical protein